MTNGDPSTTSTIRETLPNLKDLVDVFDFMITNISGTHDELLQILATVLLTVMTCVLHGRSTVT